MFTVAIHCYNGPELLFMNVRIIQGLTMELQIIFAAGIFLTICNIISLILLITVYKRSQANTAQEARIMAQLQQMQTNQTSILEQHSKLEKTMLNHGNELRMQLEKQYNEHREKFAKQQLENLTILQDSIHKNLNQIQQHISETLERQTKTMDEKIVKLTIDTKQRLQEISGEVNKRLSEGFEKTTATFTDVVKRLALIDAAQKKITELSSNVVSLQEILSDKKARGAFGEVQLNGLIQNMLPTSNYKFQATLSNDKRVDCLLDLPEPTGKVAIDAKFPLESYRVMTDPNTSPADQKAASNQFKLNIRKHIQDIASKYIINGETSDGAIMFIPAEAVFAEIHSQHSDLVEYAYQSRVWLASPTTMMAILTTARAVLKDQATRKQVHIIQEHLTVLGKDFTRFEKRMDNLARHIAQANDDVKDVNTSARKISSRFGKIEKVELALNEETQSKILEENVTS